MNQFETLLSVIVRIGEAVERVPADLRVHAFERLAQAALDDAAAAGQFKPVGWTTEDGLVAAGLNRLAGSGGEVTTTGTIRPAVADTDGGRFVGTFTPAAGITTAAEHAAGPATDLPTFDDVAREQQQHRV